MTHALSERRVAIDDLEQSIVKLFASIHAATYQVLVQIREFDERAGWLQWGFENCAQWLHWRCDLSPNAARERVRMAHALKVLPETSSAFESGRLSYSKVRALVRVATPANEASLLDYALAHTAARVEERCRQMRNTLPDATLAAERAHERRSVRMWRDAERGTMTLTIELPMETGELVCQALDKAVETEAPVGPEFESVSWSQSQADAVVSMAKCYLSATGDSGKASAADSYQVVVHVDEASLRGVESRADLPVESVKRLTCDGSLVTMVTGAQGEPLNVGRKQRTVPTSLRRALWARDEGCSFPGCTHRRFVDAHHVRHWCDGGETSLDNTLLLCSSHHRLVHEGRYEIQKDHRGEWFFRRPDGRGVPATGYRPEDYCDAGVYDTSPDCAQTSMPSGVWMHTTVREPRVVYLVG